MSKQTFRSFQDLDISPFPKGGKEERPVRRFPAGERPSPVADPDDEAALFLTAVSGTVDVSQKHTLVTEELPPSRQERKMKHRAAETGSAPEAVPESTLKPQPETPSRPVPATPVEENLFADAMSGVVPISARGRDLAPAKPLPPARSAISDATDEILFGKLEFSLEYTEEFVQGHVLGLDPVVVEKLKAGSYSHEAHVDLHGQNMEQAYATLVGFIRYAYQNDKRHLIVVTGRGKNSPGGLPVLRERAQSWFTRDPFKRVILGFCTAKPGDGGAGALYILLRRRRKLQGKIIWDKTPSEEELLL